MLMIRFIALFYIALAGVALAQYVGGYSGIYNLGTTAAGPTPTTCNAGQLDFSDACNTTQYMVLFK